MSEIKALMFDIEADGLLDELTKVHCLVAKDLITGEGFRFYDGEIENSKPEDLPLSEIPAVIGSATTLAGHNIVGYDYDVLERFWGMDMSKVNTIDTLVMSQTLNPDRFLPKGCPATILNPVTGLIKKVGPHSVEAWGYRVSKKKPQIDDWRFFNDAVLHRCEEDVNIQIDILYALLKEANLDLEELIL